jgi:hypothetical protein
MAEPAASNLIEHKTDRQKEQDNELVLSYTTMRNLIGFSGMLLPLVLMLFTKEANGMFVEPSISDYYYTKNGDILVVLLSVLGVFLITYNGYDWKEKVLTTLAAFCAIGVAFSPTGSVNTDPNSVHTTINFGGHIIHFVFAAVFFISLAIVTLAYFPKTDSPKTIKPDGKKTAKSKRNMVYRICGWTMIVSVVLLLVYFLLLDAWYNKNDFPVVFLLETIAVEAFGISWLTKGETLLPDGEHYMMKAIRTVKKNLKGVNDPSRE